MTEENPTIVVVEPQRLSWGLWGTPEGDIPLSYSADSFAQSGAIRKPFIYRGHKYVAMSLCGRGIGPGEAVAYPLLRKSHDQELFEPRSVAAQGGYSGRTLKHLGHTWLFGKAVTFRPRTLERKEAVELLRRSYAYGGSHASTAGTYEKYVTSLLEDPGQAHRDILLAESLHKSLPQSQAAMREWIDKQSKTLQCGCERQLKLF